MKLSEICEEIGYAFFKYINGVSHNFAFKDRELYMIDLSRIDSIDYNEDGSAVIYATSGVGKIRLFNLDEGNTICKVNKGFQEYIDYFEKFRKVYEEKISIEVDIEFF